MSKSLNYRVQSYHTPKMKDAIKTYAKQREVSESKIVDEALRAYQPIKKIVESKK